MSSISVLGAFVAGLLSFLSPCVLPLTPVYIAQLVGPGIWEATASDRQRDALRMSTLLHAGAFVAGFSLVFLVLGATASALGALLAPYATPLRQIGGVVLVLLGLHIAGVIRLPWVDRQARFSLRQGSSGYPTAVLIGAIFGLGWTPCVGPILGGILLLAAQAATLREGVALLGVYSLGLGLPFLALGAAFDRLAPMLRRLGRHAALIERVTGLLLALMGIVIFFNWLVNLSGALGPR